MLLCEIIVILEDKAILAAFLGLAVRIVAFSIILSRSKTRNYITPPFGKYQQMSIRFLFHFFTVYATTMERTFALDCGVK